MLSSGADAIKRLGLWVSGKIIKKGFMGLGYTPSYDKIPYVNEAFHQIC